MSRWQAEENGRQNQRPTLHGCSSSTSSGDFPVIASPEESMFGTPRTGNGREYSGPVLYTPSENSREFPNPVQITSATQSRDHSRQSSRHFNGLYGFGNIANAKDRTKSVDADDMSQFRDYTMEDSEDLQTNEETRLLLSRKVPIPSAKLSPYRLIIVIRLVVMCLFFRYRILHPVRNAYVLWVISVVCEIWFAISWILDQFPKWQPITRETYLDRLSLRFENGSESRLDPVDVFVSTVDPLKEPPLVTANTVLSILSVDYPVEKVSCYVSDDGAAKLTFDAMAETAEFARKWVPFCKKYDIEPRAPEWYFSQKVNIFKDKVQTSFIKDRRAMKREYEEFKVRINGMVANAQDTLPEGWIMKDGTPWPGNNIRDHPAMIQVFLGHNGGLDTDGNELPRLLYISREKRPGFQHHKKAGAMNALVRVSAVLTNGRYMLNLDCDHYINNSKALREAMCFMMDEQVGKQTCYVQFPQRFDAIDVHDRYANRNTVFFDINMKGLDGIQGPVYVGTGCVFNRAAVYGFDAPKKQQKAHTPNCITTFFTGSKRKSENRYHENYTYRDSSVPHYNLDDVEEISYAGDDELAPSQAVDQTELKNVFGESEAFLMSTFIPHGGLPEAPDTEQQLRDAIQVISCGYEDKSSWGSEIGWIYGSVTEDILTGLKMHTRGWRSIYCMPARPAFKGTAPINLSDRLHQVLRWALGSVEILFSRHCPIWYGWSGRLKFLQRLAYINTSIYPLTSIPLLIYCVLPAICLLTNRFIIADIKTGDSLWFLSMFISIFATGILEMRWGGIGLDEWWRNEQFWVIGGVSAHLFAVVQGLVKIVVGIEPKFTVTAKSVDEDEGAGFAELYLFKWTALLIPPTTLIVLNCIGMAAGISSAISSGYSAWGSLIGRLLFSFWVVVHLYPFLKGLMGRQNRMPSFVVIWSVLLASIMSLLWVRIDPFTIRVRGPSLEQCGLAC